MRGLPGKPSLRAPQQPSRCPNGYGQARFPPLILLSTRFPHRAPSVPPSSVRRGGLGFPDCDFVPGFEARSAFSRPGPGRRDVPRG
ncbi:protein of unknown function [Streptomyces sp. KY75]|nr:protein of unknown function [Streptomyces sp. KY70]CAD5991522.1 protein of unknown function [Streptomyces sp. KY75]